MIPGSRVGGRSPLHYCPPTPCSCLIPLCLKCVSVCLGAYRGSCWAFGCLYSIFFFHKTCDVSATIVFRWPLCLFHLVLSFRGSSSECIDLSAAASRGPLACFLQPFVFLLWPSNLILSIIVFFKCREPFLLPAHSSHWGPQVNASFQRWHIYIPTHSF